MGDNKSTKTENGLLYILIIYMKWYTITSRIMVPT